MNCSVFSMNDEQYLMNSNRCSMGTPELWNEVRLTIPALIRRSSAKEDHSHSVSHSPLSLCFSLSLS
jgi:hypothetical protein